MPDIFDTISSGDIFDKIEPETKPAMVYGWGPSGFEAIPTRVSTKKGETEKGLVSGSLNVASGAYGTAAFAQRAGLESPWGFYGNYLRNRPAIRKMVEKSAAKQDAKAQELWEAARIPELAYDPESGFSGFVGYTVGQTLPFMTAATGAGLIAGPAASFLVGASVEGDNAYREAIANGATEEQANAERVIVGTINGAIEMMQAGKAIDFAKGKSDIVAKMATRIAKNKVVQNPGTRLTADWLATVAQESLEEAAQEAVQMGAAKIGHAQEFKPGEVKERIGQAALGGAIGGGVLAGGGRIAGKAYQAVKEDLLEPIDYAELEGEERPEEMTGWFVPEPRIMPTADVPEGTAEAQTALASEWRPGPRKPKTVTPEEQAVLDRLEEEEPALPQEAADVGDKTEPVKPNMYIGNVTKRAKKVWSDIFNRARQIEGLAGEVTPEDVSPHMEGAFPTKRTQVEMSAAEAQETLAQLEETMDEMLASGESRTSPELAMMKAMWGDIRELREVLGKPKGQMPFRVVHGDEHLTLEVPNPTERIYTAIKGPSKKQLAQYSHKDLVTQGEALKAKFKAVARAASKAYRQGNKEGVEKLRRHLRALKAKQRTLRMVRQYRKKLVQRITKPVSEGVDPLYRQAIKIMAGALDPTARTAKTRKELAGLERALKADPEIALRMKSSKSLNKLRRLYQTPIEQVSTEQLQDLAEERVRLEKSGRLETRQMHRRQRAKEIDEQLKAALKQKPEKAGLQGMGRYGATKTQKLRDWMRKKGSYYGLGQYRIERWMENLDGFTRGAWTQFVWEPMKRLATVSSMRRNQRIKEYYEFLKSGGIDPALFMGHKQDIILEDGKVIKLSPFEQMGIYAFSQEETARSHLADMQLSDKDIGNIAEKVAADSQMKEVADWMLGKLDRQWEQILHVAHEIGIDPTKLVKVAKYLPLLVRNVDYMEQDDLLRRALGEFIPEDYQAERKFLEERKPKAKGDVEIDIQMLYLHSINEVEHFLTMAPMLSRLSHIMADDEFRKLLDSRTYGHGSEILAKWVVDTARGRVVREHSHWSRLMHKLNRHGIVYALGYNIPVVLRQSISSLNAMSYNPRMIPRFIQSVMMSSASREAFDALREDVFAKSNVVRERDMEHYMADLWNKKHIKKMVYRQFGHRFKGLELSKKATSWIRFVDMWTVVNSWKSAYDVALEEGASEKAAVRYADRVIQRTQPMARPEDLPHFFRGGIIDQWLALFNNQVNQNLNFWVHDVGMYRKQGKINNTQLMYRIMMSYTLPAIVFGMISRGFRPPDEKQLAKDLFMYLGGAPFFFGRVLTSAIMGWGNSLGLASMLLEGPTEIMTGIKDQDASDVLKGAAKTLAMLSPGFITAQMMRSGEGLVEMNAGDIDDPRRLIWSEWALKQGQEKESKTKTTRRRKRRRRRR